jgi:hypothetical protein
LTASSPSAPSIATFHIVFLSRVTYVLLGLEMTLTVMSAILP